MITLGIPTLTRYMHLAYLIASAERGTVPPDRYLIIDNGGHLDTSGFEGQAKIQVIRPGGNIGVAASWNRMLRDTPEYLIISNDDVILEPTTVETLVAYAEHSPNEGFLHGKTATDGNAWSLFMHRLWLFEQIGPYDEGFWPAYFEDNDMGYRMLLAGILPRLVPGCVYQHIGSATLQAYSAAERERHDQRFRINEERYTQKWGGLPHQERHIVAFGGNLA